MSLKLFKASNLIQLKTYSHKSATLYIAVTNTLYGKNIDTSAKFCEELEPLVCLPFSNINEVILSHLIQRCAEIRIVAMGQL